EAGNVVFEVSDNGEGIPEANLSRIFEPFFTTKDTGSGLGLWMCRAIVQDHGGTLEAENLKPQGCCFRVRLPAQGRERP
ncbi:MAG TPA: ATP-binding protein, partial [bacterium]|nr:ATP-binding protein [bacterium]